MDLIDSLHWIYKSGIIAAILLCLLRMQFGAVLIVALARHSAQAMMIGSFVVIGTGFLCYATITVACIKLVIDILF